MANIEYSRPAPFGAVALYRVVSLVEGAWRSALAWNTARRTARTLSALSDHELNDIGLSRGDIDRVAGTAFSWR